MKSSPIKKRTGDRTETTSMLHTVCTLHIQDVSFLTCGSGGPLTAHLHQCEVSAFLKGEISIEMEHSDDGVKPLQLTPLPK